MANRKIPPQIINFFQKQSFVIVSTIDPKGRIHSSIKSIGTIEENNLYLIDLYKANTFNNLQKNSIISITAIDEENFEGYTLKGKAIIINKDKIKSSLIKKWQKNVTERISKRLIRNIKKSTKDNYFPEALFPSPNYFIKVKIEEIVNLAPDYLFVDLGNKANLTKENLTLQ